MQNAKCEPSLFGRGRERDRTGAACGLPIADAHRPDASRCLPPGHGRNRVSVETLARHYRLRSTRQPCRAMPASAGAQTKRILLRMCRQRCRTRRPKTSILRHCASSGPGRHETTERTMCGSKSSLMARRRAHQAHKALPRLVRQPVGKVLFPAPARSFRWVSHHAKDAPRPLGTTARVR